ncbi:something about silencing protein 10 [Nematostella vectensis]|uniref:something about silencing protein 10 n=1 Tax=Nematostella vectensis TaxID=45351 RepID=UPI0020773892|nr:something about silencing protein 10 [Nematostella vectensis]
MGRSKRSAKPKKKAESEEESDISEPDPESEDYFKDDVGKFHSKRDKILLDPDDNGDSDNSSDEEEEVMGLELGDSEDNVEDDDDDGGDDDEDDDGQTEGLPSDKAWGKKKKNYYDADVGDADIEVDSEEEAWALEKEEEEEAIALQKRINMAFDDDDFDITESAPVEDDEVELQEDEKTVALDLTKLTKEQKLEILSRDSPELFELLNEMKTKLREIVDCLNPLLDLVKQGHIPDEGAKYIELKHKLYLTYCINIAFYLRLKAQQASVKDHPVIARIVQLRTLIKELEPTDSRLEEDIETLLAMHKNGELPNASMVQTKKSNLKEKLGKKSKQTQKLSALLASSDESDTEVKLNMRHQAKSKKRKHTDKEDIDPLAYYEEVKMNKKKAKEMKEMTARLAHEPEYQADEEGDGEGGKRAITYKISKNKGLTARKKKQERNPRVKLKKKYSKAVIKRKSQVRAVVNEETRYGGETTGIRSQLSRSIKIK